MSIKMQCDGVTFPTSAKDGNLIIHFGDANISIPFKFITEDYKYDNTEFPMSNIMCYLKNETSTVIMRFDGTVTKFNKNDEVIGFSKFDASVIYSNFSFLPVGAAIVDSNKPNKSTRTAIYIEEGTSTYILECAGDPEPIIFKPSENQMFVDELARGTYFFPRIRRVGPNSYVDDEYKYEVIGRPIKVTGYVNI